MYKASRVHVAGERRYKDEIFLLKKKTRRTKMRAIMQDKRKVSKSGRSILKNFQKENALSRLKAKSKN